MAKGITHSCANIWRGIARAGGWFSVLRVARDWDGVYSLDEIGDHLATLKRGGFLESTETRREGTVFAFTTKCQQLPGEQLVPVTAAADEPQATTSVAGQVHRDVMRTVYRSPKPTYRAGALDFEQCPSLHMGQRRAFRSEAA